MTKINLIFPPPSEKYGDVIWSAKEAPSPPQTAPSELGAYVKQYASGHVEVQAINPQTKQPGQLRYYAVEEIVDLCVDSDLVGMTCLYHNQETALEIAKAIKRRNLATKVVLGGQNVSNRFMARLILEQTLEVDYVVLGEGEDALLGLVEEKPLIEVPNLAYREGSMVRFTGRRAVDINKVPIWDYEDTLNAQTILEAHDSRTSLYQELVRRYNGRTLGEIGVFSQRGCPKAAGEIGNHPGSCRFCTSSESSRSQMDPLNFWRQLELLNHKYGLQDFFIADNVFGISLAQLRSFQEARRQFDIPDSIRFRAYTYPEIINGSDGKEIAKLLRELGIVNIFLGVETFSPEISGLANKDPVTYEKVAKAITLLGAEGIDTFVSFMPGLPGETEMSLRKNLEHLDQLLTDFSSKEYGKGHLTRVDISPAMPLVGTAWHLQLVHDTIFKKNYLKMTNRALDLDPTPDFDVLRTLSLRYCSEVTEADVKAFVLEARAKCISKMNPEMIGGFDLRKSDIMT